MLNQNNNASSYVGDLDHGQSRFSRLLAGRQPGLLATLRVDVERRLVLRIGLAAAAAARPKPKDGCEDVAKAIERHDMRR